MQLIIGVVLDATKRVISGVQIPFGSGTLRRKNPVLHSDGTARSRRGFTVCQRS